MRKLETCLRVDNVASPQPRIQSRTAIGLALVHRPQRQSVGSKHASSKFRSNSQSGITSFVETPTKMRAVSAPTEVCSSTTGPSAVAGGKSSQLWPTLLGQYGVKFDILRDVARAIHHIHHAGGLRLTKGRRNRVRRGFVRTKLPERDQGGLRLSLPDEFLDALKDLRVRIDPYGFLDGIARRAHKSRCSPRRPRHRRVLDPLESAIRSQGHFHHVCTSDMNWNSPRKVDTNSDKTNNAKPST